MVIVLHTNHIFSYILRYNYLLPSFSFSDSSDQTFAVNNAVILWSTKATVGWLYKRFTRLTELKNMYVNLILSDWNYSRITKHWRYYRKKFYGLARWKPHRSWVISLRLQNLCVLTYIGHSREKFSNIGNLHYLRGFDEIFSWTQWIQGCWKSVYSIYLFSIYIS